MTDENDGRRQVTQPSPVRMSWDGHIVQSEQGEKVVIILAYHPVGTFASFQTPDEVIELGKQMISLGEQAKSGVIIPTSAEVVKWDQKNRAERRRHDRGQH